MRTYDPFATRDVRRRDLEALQRQFERVFGLEGGGEIQQAFLPGRAARAYPLVNIAEDADGFTVEALAPGIDPEALQITVVRNVLTISGHKTGPEGVAREAYHRSERAAGRFVRNIELPTEVDGDHVDARYTNGLLVVRLPKHEAAKPRQIKVAVS